MSLSIKYIPLYSKNVDAEVEFFIQHFGLIHAGKILINTDIEGVLVKLDADKELYLLFIPSERKVDPSNFKIIINTNDCLKEYLAMKNEGVEFEERPHYLSSGLAACFKLSEGSHFLLLEERNYDEPFS